MIVFLRGTVYKLHASAVDLDVSGVGYRVFVPEPAVHALREGVDVFLHTYQHIREDAEELYGFVESADRDWFELLISVSGIGPRSAIQVLSAGGRGDFYSAVIEENIPQLTKFPGIGKKTAERIILELRDKVPAYFTLQAAEQRTSVKPITSGDGVVMDIVEALKSLGYNERQALEAAEGVFLASSGELTLETGLRLALQRLDGSRALPR